MPRIPYLRDEEIGDDDTVQAIRKRRGGGLLNLDRLLLYSPPVAAGWNQLLGAVRTQLSLPARWRELAICAVAVLNDRLFSAFCTVIGQPALRNDPRMANDESRRANEPVLAQAIAGWAGNLTAAQAVAALSAAGVPASELASARDAWRSDQARARGLASDVVHPLLGQLSVPEQPVHFSGSPRGGRRAATALNEHGAEIRAELETRT